MPNLACPALTTTAGYSAALNICVEDSGTPSTPAPGWTSQASSSVDAANFSDLGVGLAGGSSGAISLTDTPVNWAEFIVEILASNPGSPPSGATATTFYGAQHLAGMTVTGLADGVVIPPFVMPASGSFTLATAASIVTVGLGFTPQLQTLAIDLGEPTAQGKRKKITAVTVRVKDALGLSIGGSAATLTPMKDLVVGNVGTMSNGTVGGLVTGDARTIIDPSWTVPGQYFIQQSSPYPASILGVIPEVTVGDTQERRR